jgi:outer membrane receptor protein involved in Fe transport
MNRNDRIARAVRLALASGAAASAALCGTTALAQDDAAPETTVVVTGTRITAPGVTSSSPIYSVGAQEIALQQQPEVEKILRLLPITVPDDGQNANNGSVGAATINLRGLGPQRNLIMIDGKRITPYNFNGLVDTSVIPTALIERVDIVTGGASAVYGSDAISGALNFVMKRDFEGFALNVDSSQTEESDGKQRTASMLLGANVADGRGNVTISVNWTDRDGVQLGARPLGQLGIDTATGDGLAEFLAGEPPPPPPAGCGGPGAVAAGGSPTTIPTHIEIAGGAVLGQFRDDGTLGADCSVFNFNPFNYYQTPQERYGGAVTGRFEMNEHVEAYSRFSYSSTEVRAQVAPSGIFFTPFYTPLANPFISDQARASIIAAANAGVADGTVVSTPGDTQNWRDLNGDGAVDAGDDLLIAYARRTSELGARSTTYDNNSFQFVVGMRGDIVNGWNYDVSFQRGEADRTNTNAGYTNVAHIEQQVDSVDGVTCRSGAAGCVPINLFGGFGTITPEAAAYASASAIEQQSYDQQIAQASISGQLGMVQLPWAGSPLAVSFGGEYREESAETVPDECLKLAPASCLGGAGGNTLPIAGGFRVHEVFGEAIMPLVSDHTGMQSIDVELGYRWADYDRTGQNRTWKYGLNWRPIDSLLLRAMKQRAARAPNVGELAAPQVSALDNAQFDPCSVGNPNPIDATLRQLCISTGMSDPQVGSVSDLAAGQINSFQGTDLDRLPEPELADTLTVGFVWTPQFERFRNTVLSLDYYDIDIDKVIGNYTPQEILDACYDGGQAAQCAKIRRVGGNLLLPGSGIETFTTNLNFLKAEGVELGASFGLEIGRFGALNFQAHVNKYLTQESQSDSTLPVLDCLGHYGPSCLGPLPEIRWIQRTSWDYRQFEVSYLWRHLGSVDIEQVVAADTFPEFRHIDAFDYVDLSLGYQVNDSIRVSFLATNIFDKDVPVVGNEAADTTSNSGNTFPSVYDPLGRVFSLGVDMRF